MKPTQSTRDCITINTSNNSTFRKSSTGSRTDKKKEKIQQQSSNNRSVTPFNVQGLIDFKDSFPDPIHFIEKGFQAKAGNSIQRNGEDKKDTDKDSAFQLIQKIHNQLQQVQWDLQRLHSMHKYEF